MAKGKGNWIADMGMKKGALHAQLGVPPSKPIPAAKLNKAASGAMGPLAARRANLAKTLKGLGK